MTAVPVIETARLRLRPFRADDLPAMAAMLVDPDVVRYVGGTAFSREDSWRRMLAGIGMWDFLGYGYWALERLSDDRWIGQLGFADFKRGLEPAIEGLPEMGWMLTADAQGQGYASEAVNAAIAWADTHLGGEYVAIIDPGNKASIRLAEKCGFSAIEDAVYRNERILLLRRPPASPAATSSAAAAAARGSSA